MGMLDDFKWEKLIVIKKMQLQNKTYQLQKTFIRTI